MATRTQPRVLCFCSGVYRRPKTGTGNAVIDCTRNREDRHRKVGYSLYSRSPPGPCEWITPSWGPPMYILYERLKLTAILLTEKLPHAILRKTTDNLRPRAFPREGITGPREWIRPIVDIRPAFLGINGADHSYAFSTALSCAYRMGA